MKIGFGVSADEGIGTAFVELAVRAEAAGFESISASEHVVFSAEEVPPDFVGKVAHAPKLPDSYAHVPDPFILLAAAASRTSTIRLGTTVSILPEHHPVNLAKTLATLDLISGGRIFYGAGVSSFRKELEILGVDYRTRYSRFVESAKIMKALWSREDAVSYDGRFFRFAAARCYPKPVQPRGIPIYIGAGGYVQGSERALRMVLECGDGWMPNSLSPERLKLELAGFRQMCAEAGRDYADFEFTAFVYPYPGSRQEAQDIVGEFAEAGMHRVIAGYIVDDGTDPFRQLDRAADLFLC